ncbi:MAG: hypothetical protein P4L57_13365 [Rhizomicrobium sp.]|nr:hypothetical protein [Rhizomicrobium sp.]
MRRPILLGVSLGVIGVAVAGCIMTSQVDVMGCKDFACRVTPYPAVIASNGSEVTLPLLCRDEAWRPSGPKGEHEWLTALVYTVANGQWRQISYSQDQADVENRPAHIVTSGAVADLELSHSCAADCSKFVHLRQINPPRHGYHFEVFYSENGVERQLSHFAVPGPSLAWPRLSADGRTVVARLGRDVAIIDVASGETRVVPAGERARSACTSGPR